MSVYYGVTRTDDYLAHFGVKGMKWGVRNEKKRSEKRAAKLKKYKTKQLRRLDIDRIGSFDFKNKNPDISNRYNVQRSALESLDYEGMQRHKKRVAKDTLKTAGKIGLGVAGAAAAIEGAAALKFKRPMTKMNLLGAGIGGLGAAGVAAINASNPYGAIGRSIRYKSLAKEYDKLPNSKKKNYVWDFNSTNVSNRVRPKKRR